jgi:hypothetical protein
MRKLYFAVASVLFIFSACTKTSVKKNTTCAINEPPAIKVITPTTTQTLKAGDILQVKAMFSDHDIVYVASWEALRASGVCGNNPYSGQFEPKIPPNFAGDQIIRLYGVDGQGNISTLDIPFKATN